MSLYPCTRQLSKTRSSASLAGNVKMRIIKRTGVGSALVALALLLLSGIISFPVAATGIAVIPSHLEISDALRGGEFERNISIYNPDTETTDYTLVASGDAGGWISFYEQDTGSTTVSSVNRITIPGNSNVRMLVKFTIPYDATNGEYAAAITVTTVPEEEAAEGSGQTLLLAASVAVTIIVTGDQILSGVVNSITANDIEVEYPLRMKVQFQNSGNVVAKPQITVTIATKDGKVISQFTSDEFNIKPEKLDTISLEWDTTGQQLGDYVADISVVLGDALIKREQLSFAILPVGTLTRSGSLTELKFVDEPRLGSLTTIQATFVNTGQIDTRAKFIGEVYHDNTLVDTLQSEELLVVVGNTELLKSYFEPDQPGEYRITGYVIYENRKTEEKEISCVITEDVEVVDSVDATSSDEENLGQTFDPLIIILSVIGALIIIGITYGRLRSRKQVKQ